jgi:hypothetical protein
MEATEAKQRTYRECLMSPGIIEWLKSIGCATYAEVPVVRLIDHVGVRWSDKHIVCVEMKCSLTHKLLYQAHILQLITPAVYMAVPNQPRKSSIEQAARTGLGLLVNGRVVLEPEKKARHVVSSYRDLLLDRCRHLAEDGVGGLPQMKGDGPAIRAAAACREYLKQNPKAKWHELFAKVPNHYAHARSMAGAIGPIWRLTDQS